MKVRFDWAYRRRGILMAPPYLVLFFVFAGEVEYSLYTWVPGLMVFALGVLIRVWAQMHLHYRLEIRKQLTLTGPYRFVRNPIYIANTLMLLGLTAMSELLWFVPVMLLWCMGVYSLVVRREEAHLSEKYGEPYLQFLRDIPRWIPQWHKSVSPRAMVRAFFWPSVRAELHCLLLLIPLVCKELIIGS